MNEIKKIPYGQSTFMDMSKENAYYVDRTMYISEIEDTKYVFLIRPRRFGKSLFLSTLYAYYDVKDQEEFDTVFKNTWIHNNQTPYRGKYLILYFNFSAITKDIGLMQSDFNNYCCTVIDEFLYIYREYIPDRISKAVEADELAHAKLHKLAVMLNDTEHKLYILIDEYDHFTNVLLSEQGIEAYHAITKGVGFFKQFFINLKFLTSGKGSALERLFITGVSPTTMDDVSSGFNIGDNISLLPKFNNIVGFTEKEAREILAYYISAGKLNVDIEESVAIFRKWYDNYRFSDKAKESLYNTDCIWYFVKDSMRSDGILTDVVNDNLRMDTRKLSNLVVLNKQLNGNFDILSEVINTGKTYSVINKSFPYEQITQPDNFVSMLYFLGLLTFSKDDNDYQPCLKIPNETIKKLMFEYITNCLSSAYEANVSFNTRTFNSLILNMIRFGDYKPVFEFITNEMNKKTSIRDFIYGENVVKLFFLFYLSYYDYFFVSTEKELNKGYADVVMMPNSLKYKDLNYMYLIEFKYIKRSVEGEAFKTELNKKMADAKAKLEQYADADEVDKISMVKLISVFYGWEMIVLENVL